MKLAFTDFVCSSYRKNNAFRLSICSLANKKPDNKYFAFVISMLPKLSSITKTKVKWATLSVVIFECLKPVKHKD